MVYPRDHEEAMIGGRDLAMHVTLGIVIPAVMLRFDPFVLGGQDGDSLVGSLSAGVYVLMFLSMTAFLGRLILGRGAPRLSWLLGGARFAGSLVSGLLGTVMLPLSVLGIRVYGLGLLGFYPFVSAILYFRTARSALWETRGFGEPASPNSPARRVRLAWALGGFAMVLTIPAVLWFAANRELDRLTAAAHAGMNFSKVDWQVERYLTWAGDSDRILRQFREAQPGQEQRDLDLLYRQLSGRDAQTRLEQLRHAD